MTASPWIKPVEAAAYLTVSLDTFYKACQVGGLRHVRVNGKRNIRTTLAWCDEWMQRDTRQVDAGRNEGGTDVAIQTVRPSRAPS